MSEEADIAFCRYEAMYGLLSNIPEAVERRAARDRAEFAERYIWKDFNGEPSFHYLMAIRFMVEICGIPLRDAWAQACEDLEGVEQTDLPDAQTMARQLFASQRGILMARELVRFFGDVYQNQYWRDVMEELETGAMAPLDTGSEDWDE